MAGGASAESCLSIVTLSLPLLLFKLAAGESLETTHNNCVQHAGLLSQSPLISNSLRSFTWLFHRLLYGIGPAKEAIAEAFEVLFLELRGQCPDGSTAPTLIDLLEMDLDILFWGGDRQALGRSETGAVRGTSVSTFSVS